MKVTWATELTDCPGPPGDDEARRYDAFVLSSPAGHASQTRAWSEVARAAGHVVTRFAVVRDGDHIAGTALAIRPRVAGVSLPWAWIERGPVVAQVEDLARVTRAVARSLRRQGVAWLRVMPYWSGPDAERAELALRSLGMRDVQKADGPHASTLRLAIGGVDAEALFAGKSKEQVRWRAGQAKKAGALARRGTSEDWTRLRRMHAALMRSQGRRDRPDAWWQTLERFASDDARGAIFACDFEGRTVAAAVTLRHGPLATYAWGASVPEKLPFTKAIPALLAAIRWARDVGCTTFDLGGVPLDGDADPKRNAIATFKYDFDRQRVRLVREHAGWC